MTWYAVYRESDGALHSTGEVVATEIELAERGLVAVPIAFNPQVGNKRWNAIARLFDNVPPVKPAIQPKDFLDRFTATERSDIIEASRNDTRPQVRKQLQAFFQYIQLAGVVDMHDSYVVAVVNGMETAGLISSGRASVILG